MGDFGLSVEVNRFKKLVIKLLLSSAFHASREVCMGVFER